MKNLKLPGLALTAFLFCATLAAQDKAPLNEPDRNKPVLFKNLPEQVPVKSTDLHQLLSQIPETGKAVTLPVSANTLTALKGKIVSSAVKFQNTVRSVVVRLDDFNGATLTLSSSTKPDGTVTYTGRIISFQHRDLYELKIKNEQYILMKKDFYELINE